MNNELQDAIETLNRMTEKLEAIKQWIVHRDDDIKTALCHRYCFDFGEFENANNTNDILCVGENLHLITRWLLDNPDIAQEFGIIEND